MAITDPNYNQFAVSDLIKSPGDVLKQNAPEALPYNIPISGPGNISFPFDYSGNKQIQSPMVASMDKFYNSGPSEKFQASPIKFNADALNVARYMSSPDYFKLGVSLYGNNEENYGQNQSWSEVLSNGYDGMKRLAANGFVDTWKGWGRMIDALSHWDWSKLHGDAQSMMELDQSMNDAMNDNPIYATQEGMDTFWNRQMFGNFMQQSGFTVGALGATASEWIVTKAIEAGLAATFVGAPAAGGLEAVQEIKTAADLGRIGRMFQKSKEFYDAAKNFKALKKIHDTWTQESVIKNVFSTIGRKVPGIDIGMEMYQAGKIGTEAGLSGTKLASTIAKAGAGGLKRTMSEANFAFSEARMEAAGTFSDLYSQMQQQYYTDHGIYATGNELQKMQDTSMQAADKNFNFNSAVLAVSNRIQFDNLFKGSKIISKIASKFGDDAAETAENILKVTGKHKGRTTTQYYTDGLLSNYKNISKTFGKTTAIGVTVKSIMKPLLKFEVGEGIQELLQEGSNNYYKDYYLDLYRSSYNSEIQPDSERSFDKAVESQKNMQGLKTFASGALTGMMIHGPVSLGERMLKKANTKIQDDYAVSGLTGENRIKALAERKAARESYKGYYTQFNAIAKDPEKFFPEAIKNFNIQKEGASALEQAANANDKFAYENIRTDMLHSMMTQSYRNNTHEGLIDTLRQYGKHMSKEEFEQAFVGMDYTSDTKKSVQDYTEKIATSLESYVKTRKRLDEKFSSYANPNKYEYGSKDWFNESYKKKVLNDMLDVLAGNEFKATDALNRSTQIFSKLNDNKAMGASLATAYNILGSDENIKKEIAVLNNEIETKKQQLKSEGITIENKNELEKEIKLKEDQKKSIEEWAETKNELIDETKVSKSYESYKNYLDSKNKENGRFDNVINNEDVKDSYNNLIDYINLNKKAGKHVEAINMLSNPTYFDQIHTRMQAGAKLAFMELAHEAAAEYIKSSGGVKENEHFILEVSGQFGIFNPSGVLISLADDADEAEKIKEELDEKVYGKKKPKEKQSKEEGKDDTEEDEEDTDVEEGELEAEAEEGDFDALITALKTQRSNIKEGITQNAGNKKEFQEMSFVLATSIMSYPIFYDYVDKILDKMDEDLALPDANEEEITAKYDKILEDLKEGIIPEFLKVKKKKEKTEENITPEFDVDSVVLIDGEIATIKSVIDKEKIIEYTYNLNSDIEKFNNKEITQEELDKLEDVFFYDKKNDVYSSSDGELIDVSLQKEEENKKEEKGKTPAKKKKEDTSKGEYEFFDLADSISLDNIKNFKLQTGQSLVDDGVNGLFIIKSKNGYSIVYNTGKLLKQKVINPKTKKEMYMSPVFTDEKEAIKKRNELAKEREDQLSNEKQSFEFSGKTISYGQIIKDTKGKYFVVLSKSKAEDNGRIKVQKLNYTKGKYSLSKQASSSTSVKDITDYSYVYKQTGESDKSKFKLYGSNFYQIIQAYKTEEDKTNADASKRLDDLLINTPQEDLNKNLSVEIYYRPKDKRGEAFIAGGESMKNINLIDGVKAQSYTIVVKYKGDPIGYIQNDSRFLIKDRNGDIISIQDMDVDTFKLIFNTENGNPDALLLAFKNSHKKSSELINYLIKSLGKNEYSKEFSGEELVSKFGFELSNGEYDYAKPNLTPFNKLDHQTFDGYYVFLDTLARKGKAKKGKGLVITNAKGNDKIKIDNELDEKISKDRELLKYFGRYVAAVKLPNGNIVFVELATQTMQEDAITTIINDVNSQSKKTKEDNLKTDFVQETNPGGKIVRKEVVVGANKSFNDEFNDEISEKLFIRVFKERGFSFNLEVSPTGNLVLDIFKTVEGTKGVSVNLTVKESNDKEPLNFKNIDEFLERINKAIADYNTKISDDQAYKKINVTLTKEDFKESISDTANVTEIISKNLMSRVTPNIVKNVKLTMNPDVEILDDVFENPKSNKTKNTTKKKADLTVEEDEEEIFVDGEKEETPPPFEVSDAEPVTLEEKKKPAPTIKPTLTKEDVVEVKSDADEYANLVKEKEEYITQKTEEYKVSLGNFMKAAKKAKEEANNKYDKKLEDLKNKHTGDALKVTNQENFDKASVVDITEFKKWISKNFPDFVSVEEMDMLETNMKKGMVTVGMFTAYMKILQDGSKSVAGKIKVGANTPFKYHEAFHAIFRLMLSEEKIENYLRLAKEEELTRLKGDKVKYKELINEFKNIHPLYSTLNEKELEERYLEEKMADRFDEWKTNKQVKTNWSFKTFFAKLFDLIKSLFRRHNKNEIDALFNQIDNGKFKNAKLQENRFTKENALSFTEPAYKVIEIGEDLVKDENGKSIVIKKYLSQSKSDKLSSTIASIFDSRMEKNLSNNNNQYNKKELLDGVLNDYKNLYNPERKFYEDSLNALYEIDPEAAEKKLNDLEQLHNIFSNETNRKTLLEAVDVHLRIMGYNSELESNEYEELIDDYGDRVTTDSWKETHSIGGFGSLSQKLRQYIATTTMPYVDEFGNTNLITNEETGEVEPLIESVNANMVYNGVLKSISNISNQEKIVKRLELAIADDTETGKFISRFFEDVGLEINNDGSFNIKNDNRADLFQSVIKGFQQYNVDYIFINKDIRTDKKISRIFYANRKDSSKTQFTQWQNAYSTNYEKQLLSLKTEEQKDDLAEWASKPLENLYNLLSGEEITDEILDEEAVIISNDLKNRLGVSLSKTLIKYSAVSYIEESKRTIEQQSLYESYENSTSITPESINQIILSVKAFENPFAKNIEKTKTTEVEGDETIPEEEDLGEGGVIKRLNELAKANVIFDETVYSTSFKNAAGELVYSHQLPTYNLTKVTDLNDEEVRDVMMNDSFLRNNYLLNSPEFQALFGDLKVERIDGLKSSLLNITSDGDIIENKTLEINQLDGTTYGKFGPREFAVTLLDLYAFNKLKKTKEGNQFYTSNHLIRVLEASNTGDTVGLPVIKSVRMDRNKNIILADEAINILKSEIKNEIERIKEVKQEIKNYEEFGILPPKGLLEGYHYKLIEDEKTKELVRDFTKGRGISFYKIQNLLGSKLSDTLLSNLESNPEYLLDEETEKLINPRLNEYFKEQIDEYLNQLNELNVISYNEEENEYTNNLVDDFIENGFGAFEEGKEYQDDDKNNLLNIIPGNIKHNISQVFVNDFINTLAINQLLLGDEALSLKDSVDQVKRAKGSNASGPNAESIITSNKFGIKHEFTKCHITVMDDPKYLKKFGDNKGKTGDQADAQMYMTSKGSRYMKFGLGRLTERQVKVLDKIDRGEKLDENEVFGESGLISQNEMFNSEKLVYFDGKIYIKTSAIVLTKELTSRFDKSTNKWVAKIGREELHKMREQMEAFENKNNSVSIVVPSSASKGLKRNVIRNVDEFDHQNADQFTEQETKYWRLQVENPSNKLIITDPTQAKQLITAEQDDDLDVYFSWNDNGEISKSATPIKMKKLKEMYYSDTAQRVNNNYVNARNEIFDIEGAVSELSASKKLGKITPKLGKFQKKALETLRSTGADSQLLEFFSIDDNEQPVYNLNNPLTLDKYTQLFLAYFSKGVMSEKIPGISVALMSNYGLQVVKRFTGKYTESGEPIGEVIKSELVDKDPTKYNGAKRMKDKLTRTFDNLKEGDYYVDDLRHNVPEFDKAGNITGYYTEFMLPPHFRELLRLLPEEAIPEVIWKAFGVRIPTQDKHSFINLKMVDYLPSFMGSTGVFAHELIEISGADFDIDKLYMAIHDFYVKDNKFIAYGSADTDSKKYEEYIRWNLEKNKDFKKYFKELKSKDAVYMTANKRLKSIKSLRDQLNKLIKTYPSTTSSQEYKIAINANNFINGLINNIDNLDFTSSEDDFNFMQQSFDKLLTTISAWDTRDFAIGIAENTLKELKSLAKDSKDEINKLKDAEQRLIRLTIEEFNMPLSVSEFIKKSEKGELNNGILNNRILDTKIALFGNSKLVTGKDPIAFEPATVDALQELVKIFTDAFVDQSNPENNVKFIENILIESGVDVDNLLGKLKSFSNNKEGSRNIGAAVNAMLGYNVLNTFKIKLRESYTNKDGETEYFPMFEFDGQAFNSYANTNSYNFETKKFDGTRIAGVISTLVSAMTDNAKERLAAKLGLNMEALGYVSNMVSLGVPLKTSVLYMLQPVVLDYFKTMKINSSNLQAPGEKRVNKKELIKSILSSLQSEIENKSSFKKIMLTDDLLNKNIKEEGVNPDLQFSIMMDFAVIVNQTDYFNKISQVLKLTKGLGTSWESKAAIDGNIEDLGLKLENFEKSEIPIDLRQVFLGSDSKQPYHKFMKTYINISDQIEKLSSTTFIEKTEVFKRINELIYSNFEIKKHLLDNFNVSLKRDLVSYLCIRAYTQTLKKKGNVTSLSSLSNGLIYDAIANKKDPKTFSDIVKTVETIRKTLPNNYIANNFLNLIKTYRFDLESGDIVDNEYNKDGINKIESNTWAKLSEYQQEKLLDSFIEIYQNDELRGSGAATTLFHYLLVKDGGQFKSGSFIKFVPNFMFKTMMDASKEANELLYKPYTKLKKEEYKSIFGLTYEELMNDFLNVYISSVSNELFVKSIKNLKQDKYKNNGKTPAEQEQIDKELEEYDETKCLVINDKGISINVFNGIREKYINKEIKGVIKRVINPAFKGEYTNTENSKLSKNYEYLKSKGFYIKYDKDKDGNIIGKTLTLPTELKVPAYNDTPVRFYRLKSVGKEKTDKDNPLDLIDVENDETIASGIRAYYVKVDKAGSKKQTKIAHMFEGVIPPTAQLPNVGKKTFDTFSGWNPDYNETDEIDEVTNTESSENDYKEVESKKSSVKQSNVIKKLETYGIIVKFNDKGKVVYSGELWKGMSKEIKSSIKSHADLLRLLEEGGSVNLKTSDEEPAKKIKKVVVSSKRQSAKSKLDLADELPHISQSDSNDPKDYSRGKYLTYVYNKATQKVEKKWKERTIPQSVIRKVLSIKGGKDEVITSLDMVKAGVSTRKVVSKTWMEKIMDRLNIENQKSLVGTVIKQIDEFTGEAVYTQITSVNKFTEKYQEKTWDLEGWSKDITNRLLKKYKDTEGDPSGWAIEFKLVSPNRNYVGVEKVISGFQDGVDREVGLDAAKDLGLKTGGTAPEGFKTQEGYKPELAKKYNVFEADGRFDKLIDTLKENWIKFSNTTWYDTYYARNIYNILNSDATVIFAKDVKSTGTQATIDMLKALPIKKPYIINPTAKQLKEFLDKHKPQTINIAGNRATKLGTTNAEIIKKIKEFKDILKSGISEHNSEYVNEDVVYNKEETYTDQYDDSYEETYEEEEDVEEEYEDDDEANDIVVPKKETKEKEESGLTDIEKLFSQAIKEESSNLMDLFKQFGTEISEGASQEEIDEAIKKANDESKPCNE